MTAVVAAIVETLDELEPHRSAWDELACALGRPLCAPSWMLSWWRHNAPPSASLRTVVATSGGRLVGVAPYFAQTGSRGRTDYRLLGSGVSQRIAPLAEPGLE